MKKIVSLIIIMSLFFSGCFSYSDINKILFVTSVIIDIDKDKRPIIYVEAFKPFRSSSSGSEKGQRILIQGTGKTAYEALRDINLATSYKLNYTQNKIVMFTIRAAKEGIDNWIDIFDRNQEFVIRPYLVMTEESPENLLNLGVSEQEYLGILLKDLISNEGASTRSVRLSLNDYLNLRLIGSKTEVVTLIGIKKDQLDQRMEILGGAIIKNDKFETVLPRVDGEGYNFLMNTLKTGSLEVSNPNNKDKFISLNILKNNTKTYIEYDGKRVKLIKDIEVKTNIEEIQKNAFLNDKTIIELKKKSEDNIKKACMRVFKKYKDENLDIFQVQEMFERKYPKVKIDNVIGITELEIIVNENLEGSPDTQDFWN